MTSGFNYSVPKETSGEWIPIETASERYSFYMTRLYGQLHFIKTLPASKQIDLISIEALRKEFHVGYSLQHPYIVRYLQFENNAIYEEFVDGKTLRQMLDTGDGLLRDRRFIAKICRQLLEAVEYLHSKGILHLDLKPENVMITRVGSNVKIIDLGCAYTAENDATQGFTLQYRAPEQENGETNAYTDIYLIGRIASELAAYAGCARRWRKFIAKATAEKPAERFQTEQQAIAAIPSERSKRWLLWSIPIAAVLIGMVITLLPKTKDLEKLAQSETAVKTTAQTEESVDSVVATDRAKPMVSTGDFPSEVRETHDVAMSQSTPPTVSATPAPVYRESLSVKLDREISQYVSSLYLKNVKPKCPPDSLTSESEEAFQRLLAQTIRQAYAYGDNLIAKYPQEEAHIRSKVTQEINAQQSQTAIWFYGKRSGIY